MSQPLEEELAALFGRGVEALLPEAEFDRLALSVFAHQFERNGPYQGYCRARGKTPDTVGGWMDVPALHTSAFKEVDLTTVPRDEVRVEYRTSGTSRGVEKRGRHLLPDTRLYDASLLPNFRAHLLPDRETMRILICGPTAEEFPHSSLGHMHSRVREAFGAAGSGVFWREDGPRFGCLAAALEKAQREGEPVCILGTVFGLVHFLDWLAAEGREFCLPPGSRIMDTGGSKGRVREVPRPEMLRQYEGLLGIAERFVVNEYGMTELGSQFYDRVAGNPERTGALGPPWVRALVVHPDTLEPLAPGETGLLRFFDLANLHSISAIQTDDLGVYHGAGFEILGRASGAEPRGCSLAVEEL
jgi:hypothetical protein